MKKILAILGVAIFAMAALFSTNTVNSIDTDLASLITINKANAEEDDEKGSYCAKDTCTSEVTETDGSVTTYNGHYWHCKDSVSVSTVCVDSDCDEECDAKPTEA